MCTRVKQYSGSGLQQESVGTPHLGPMYGIRHGAQPGSHTRNLILYLDEVVETLDLIKCVISSPSLIFGPYPVVFRDYTL